MKAASSEEDCEAIAEVSREMTLKLAAGTHPVAVATIIRMLAESAARVKGAASIMSSFVTMAIESGSSAGDHTGVDELMERVFHQSFRVSVPLVTDRT